MSNCLRVGQYQPSDEAGILALNLVAYGPRNVMVTPPAFRWRYAENPAGSPEITVARDEDAAQVVGFASTVPLRMRLFGQDHVAGLLVNLLIHPEYRDGLVHARVLRHREQRLRQRAMPLHFTFSIEASRRPAASSEEMQSFLVPLVVRPLNTAALIARSARPRWLTLPLTWGSQVAAPWLFRGEASATHPTSLKVEWQAEFDERFDRLWAQVRDEYPIMTIRNRAFLSWRFAPVAGRSYRILTALAGDDLVGYAVLRCTDEIHNIPIGLVMDLLLEPGPRGVAAGMQLLAKAWEYFRGEKVWLAGGLALPHTTEHAVMRQSGYRQLPNWLAPPLLRVAYQCTDDRLPATAEVKASDWFLTIADYEAY